MKPWTPLFGVSLAFGLALALTGPATAFDPTAYEPGEELAAGSLTDQGLPNRNAFSRSSATMPFARELDFKVGNGFFKRIWVSAPASTKAADGLGPLFNARSCQGCHIKDGRGHPPEPGERALSMFLRLSIPASNESDLKAIAEGRLKVVADPTYGTQFQSFALPGFAPEGQMVITYEEIPVSFADGETVSLRKPSYSVANLGYGPMHPDVMLSPRVAPQMIGLGLLEALPDSFLLDAADPDDADGDGISGRVQRTWDPEVEAVRLGRFGWKAGNATVNAQSQGAFAGDIGISTPLNPAGWGECTANQTQCREAIHGGDSQYQGLEVHQPISDMVTFYSQNLAVPVRRNADDPQVVAGKGQFAALGCTGCHTPVAETGQTENLNPWFHNQTIRPYTDLLLHDMGEGLADNRPEGLASGREWRTAPLWGIGLTETVSGHTQLLHDGRARNLTEAILWHGGEAEAAKEGFRTLAKADRAALLAFLNSL
ncbi:MAG: di-heme oxidoredictase family protein [Rhodospirillaceae bacterium]